MHRLLQRNFRPARHGRWLAAYLDTAYCLYLPTGTVALHIGQTSPLLDRWLAEHEATGATIITACNPDSRLLSAPANRRLQRALLDALRSFHPYLLPGCNRAVHDAWPPEPSFCVAGLSRGGARRLGARFRQNAVVYIARGQPAQLLWVR